MRTREGGAGGGSPNFGEKSKNQSHLGKILMNE